MEKTNSAHEDRQRVRRLLWRWGGATAYCARCHREIADYNELIASAVDLRARDVTAVVGSEVADPTARAAERLARLHDRYQERVAELTEDIDKRLEFAAAMDDAMTCLGQAQHEIITLHYKHRDPYEVIARQAGYCVDRVKQIERAAVDKLRERIEFDVA